MDEISDPDPFSNAIVKETQISENVKIDGKSKQVTHILVHPPVAESRKYEIQNNNPYANPYKDFEANFSESKSVQQ